MPLTGGAAASVDSVINGGLRTAASFVGGRTSAPLGRACARRGLAARRNIDRWLARRDADDPARPDLEAWRPWLDRPIGSLTAIMTAWTEEAIRMRQSTPFAGVLRPADRRAIYEAFRA